MLVWKGELSLVLSSDSKARSHFVWTLCQGSFFITQVVVSVTKFFFTFQSASQVHRRHTVMNLMVLIEACVPCWDQCGNRCQNHTHKKKSMYVCPSPADWCNHSLLWNPAEADGAEICLASDLRIQTDTIGEREDSASLINLLDWYVADSLRKWLIPACFSASILTYFLWMTVCAHMHMLKLLAFKSHLGYVLFLRCTHAPE